MVPDFSGLRKQSCDRSSLRPLKAITHEGSSQPIIVQQFDTKPTDSVESDELGNIEHKFFTLWTTCPSWSPIVLTDKGWKTVKSQSSSKKVPLTFKTLESYYRRNRDIGKRFGQLTNYLMIDIDINSPFHPYNDGFKPILAIMERLGLVRFLIVRSSDSEGIHLYFPLPEPVNAWQLALVVHSALTASGIVIAGGQCELFPNKKSFNAEHNGHRLPLQNGSFLLDKDFCPISNCKADFLYRWETAAAHQDFEQLQQALTGPLSFAGPSTPVELSLAKQPQVFSKCTTQTGHVIPPIAWTRMGQSNDIMCELVNYGDRYVGHKTIAELANWVRAVAPQLPGYDAFASPKSKRDIERGTWPVRWAKSHFNSVWYYKVGGSDHNANVAADAKRRLFAALDLVCVDTSIGVTELFKHVASITKHCFNRAVHWKTFKKYKKEVWDYIKCAGKIGLSRDGEEDMNSPSPELPTAEIIEPESSAKIYHTKLLTLRCVIDIYSNAFSQLHTPKTGPIVPSELVAAEGDSIAIAYSSDETARAEAVELPKVATERSQKSLSIGQRVQITMPGGSLDGIEARILAQTVDTLGQPVYRLDYSYKDQAVSLPAECLQVVEEEETQLVQTGVIRATAVQLLQVLGKACPFVGPGLWAVRRDEVSPMAWGQLMRLAEES